MRPNGDLGTFWGGQDDPGTPLDYREDFFPAVVTVRHDAVGAGPCAAHTPRYTLRRLAPGPTGFGLAEADGLDLYPAIELGDNFVDVGTRVFARVQGGGPCPVVYEFSHPSAESSSSAHGGLTFGDLCFRKSWDAEGHLIDIDIYTCVDGVLVPLRECGSGPCTDTTPDTPLVAGLEATGGCHFGRYVATASGGSGGYTYVLDPGDGSTPITFGPTTATEHLFPVYYPDPGEWTATLTVTDDVGRVATAEAGITCDPEDCETDTASDAFESEGPEVLPGRIPDEGCPWIEFEENADLFVDGGVLSTTATTVSGVGGSDYVNLTSPNMTVSAVIDVEEVGDIGSGPNVFGNAGVLACVSEDGAVSAGVHWDNNDSSGTGLGPRVFRLFVAGVEAGSVAVSTTSGMMTLTVIDGDIEATFGGETLTGTTALTGHGAGVRATAVTAGDPITVTVDDFEASVI